MNCELLLCALKRRGAQGTAGEIVDTAEQVARDAGWPARLVNPSVQKASALLRNMAINQQIRKVGVVKENGREVPVYAPLLPIPQNADESMWDANYPVPERPEMDAENHPMNGMTKRQMFALFDVMQSHFEVVTKHRKERHEQMERQERELSESIQRAKRFLVGEGAIEA